MKNTEHANVEEEIKQFIVINLGEEQYGINIQYIQNIVRMIRVTRVPKAPYYIKGVANLRGEIIPVMSLRLKFDLEEKEESDETRIIFLQVEGNNIGIIVDKVNEVVQLDDENIESITRELNEEKDAYVFGIGKMGDRLVTLLNIEELIHIEAVVKK